MPSRRVNNPPSMLRQAQHERVGLMLRINESRYEARVIMLNLDMRDLPNVHTFIDKSPRLTDSIRRSEWLHDS